MGAGDARTGTQPKLLILACGALAREILAALEVNKLDHVTLHCLPASLHNRPQEIPDAVRVALREQRGKYDRILVGYADCGTGGQLDKVLAEAGVERLPGPHCYSFFSGVERFAARGDEDMRAFFLTDFLVRQFDTLIVEGMGLDRHPELRDIYFQHYKTVVYLSQIDDPELVSQARRAAQRLGLAFEHRRVGYGDLASALRTFGESRETFEIQEKPS